MLDHHRITATAIKFIISCILFYYNLTGNDCIVYYNLNVRHL